MKNIEQILKDAGVELTEEQTKTVHDAVVENYKTKAEHEKALGKLEADRDGYKSQLEAATTALAGFEGVDVEGMKAEIEKAKEMVAQAEENARKTIEARDRDDAVKALVEPLGFTSKAAKERFIQYVSEKNLPYDNGKLLGFSDTVEAFKKEYENAIVDKDAADKQVEFTAPMGTTKPAPKSAENDAKMREAFGLPPQKEE